MKHTIPDTTDSFIEGHTAYRLEIVAAINRLEATATKSELAASDVRYEQSKEVVAALAGGMTQQQVADAWKRADGTSYSQPHVLYTKRNYELNYNLSYNRPLWNDGYNSDEVRGKGSILQSSESNEWYTPSLYIDRARDVLGGIDLDPASCEAANATVKADWFYNERDDGLTKDWAGRVWMNPPYGRIAAAFVDKLVNSYEHGDVDAAICLVNANSTDTDWFQPLFDYTMCFTDHRINFDSDKDETNGSTHGSVFAYLGPIPDVFAALFKDFGTIVRRWPHVD